MESHGDPHIQGLAHPQSLSASGFHSLFLVQAVCFSLTHAHAHTREESLKHAQSYTQGLPHSWSHPFARGPSYTHSVTLWHALSSSASHVPRPVCPAPFLGPASRRRRRRRQLWRDPRRNRPHWTWPCHAAPARLPKARYLAVARCSQDALSRRRHCSRCCSGPAPAPRHVTRRGIAIARTAPRRDRRMCGRRAAAFLGHR